MEQDQPSQPLTKDLVKQNESQRQLILSAIAGVKVLSAVKGYALKTELVLADKTLLPVSILRKTEEKNCVMFVTAILKETCLLIKNNFNDDSLVDTAILLINEFHHWKIEEFAILCKEIITGKYGRDKYNPTGKIFGMLDAKTIFEAAQEREIEREVEWQKIYHNQNRIYVPPAHSTEEADKKAEEWFKKIQFEMETNHSKHTKKKPESEYQIKVKNLFNEFWKNAPYINGMQFLKYKGEQMTAEQWVKAKLKETV